MSPAGGPEGSLPPCVPAPAWGAREVREQVTQARTGAVGCGHLRRRGPVWLEWLEDPSVEFEGRLEIRWWTQFCVDESVTWQDHLKNYISLVSIIFCLTSSFTDGETESREAVACLRPHSKWLSDSWAECVCPAFPRAPAVTRTALLTAYGGSWPRSYPWHCCLDFLQLRRHYQSQSGLIFPDLWRQLRRGYFALFISPKSPFKHFLKQNIYLFPKCLQRKSMEEKGNSHILIYVWITEITLISSSFIIMAWF